MTVSEQIDQFSAENGGNTRDALNVALTRLEMAEMKLDDSKYTDEFLAWRNKYFTTARPQVKQFVSKRHGTYFGVLDLESKFEKAYNCKSKKE